MLLALLSLTLLASDTATGDIPHILPLRERAEVRDRWLEDRLDTVVPMLMRREGIDMWVLIAREYNEDPVVKTMLPARWLNARRRTILAFFDHGGDVGVERVAIARYDIGRFFTTAWNKEEQPDQWARLAEWIGERNPKKLALNVSPTFALADGMSQAQYDGLFQVLSEDLRERIVPGEGLSIGWLETRTPSEMEVYPSIGAIAHEIIAEGLSNEVIQPGVTTTHDVKWYYRERIAELKLQTWFHPSVSFQRWGGASNTGSFASSDGGEGVIHRGDLIHIDFGITYLGLNTDTQQHAYVLRYGESAPPQGLVDALKIGNRLQDHLTRNFVTGRSGNEILSRTREEAIADGIAPSIYTHPLGFHGHGAGPTIGLWDQQEGVPGRGDYPLFPNTAYAIELNATVQVPEWDNKEIRIMLEEDAFFDGERVLYLNGRQRELHVIR